MNKLLMTLFELEQQSTLSIKKESGEMKAKVLDSGSL